MGCEIIPIEFADDYVAPRDAPLEYPGRHPRYSFLLANTKLFPLVIESRAKGQALADLPVAATDGEESPHSLARWLEFLGVPPLGQRFPVVAYGSNAVPGQLVSKLGKDAVIPVVLGEIADCSVVYNLISNMGYAYAELMRNTNGVKTRLAVTFLDEKQLATMLVTEQNYRLGYLPDPVVLDNGEVIENSRSSGSYVFAGFRPVWVPTAHDSPIPIAERPAEAQCGHPLSQRETLELVVEDFELRREGIYTAAGLAKRVRAEAALPECRGKLKHELQSTVAADTRSEKPLAEQLELVDLASIRAQRYGISRSRR